MAKIITANKLKRFWQNGVVAKMVAKVRVLSSMEEIEANTNPENIAGATAVAELSNKLGHGRVELVVMEDGSLGYRLDGADSVPFFKEFKLGTIELAVASAGDSGAHKSIFNIPIDNFKRITGAVTKTYYGEAFIMLYTKEGASLTYLQIAMKDTGKYSFDIDVTEYSRVTFRINPLGGSGSVLTVTDLILQ